jgi:DNA polymerase I-like protein with 3'-5' exonuclease and polymerase domains
MSSSKPNMQQAPSRAAEKMFVAKPGWKLVDSDYLPQLFIAAYLSGDKYCLQLSKGMTFTVTLHF